MSKEKLHSKPTEPQTTRRTQLRDALTEDPQGLIEAIRRGDAEAFSNFYLGYADSLIGFLTRIIGNKDDAEEVTQDVFAHLWESREAFNPHSSVKGFVFGTARNMALRMMRNNGLDTELLDEIQHSAHELAAAADESIITEETTILLQHVIDRMPGQRRRVYEMHRMEGMTYNEIAERLDISYNTVKFHIQAALADIRSAMTALLICFFLR